MHTHLYTLNMHALADTRSIVNIYIGDNECGGLFDVLFEQATTVYI